MMPKGQAPILLPNTENIIMVKQKKKVLRDVCFLGRFVVKRFVWHNPLYSDIQIDEDNMMKLLVTDCTEEIPIALAGVHEGNGPKVNDTTIKDEEEIANPLQNYQHQAIESLVVDNNTYEIAPGEGLLAKKNSL